MSSTSYDHQARKQNKVGTALDAIDAGWADMSSSEPDDDRDCIALSDADLLDVKALR